MAVIKCKMCGGDLVLVEGSTVATCEFCGSQQTVPTADSEKKLTLFARANRLRAACDFDKAAGIYESIVADFPDEAEAYWGLVLCKYGIEYVDDPGTGKKIPTCHRSSFDSVMEDADLDQALENATPAARKVYRAEAKLIEQIRKGIISVSANEDPYDIFICYKETDENGQRTLDSVLAQDIYDTLTDKGYRVFFARISLEDKLGQEYEPYIFAALNSAKIMLAVGTDYEYFNAVWVKNEWSRFLKLMVADKNKHLIPCYKGIDAYDLPKEFARLQAQDLGKVGAIQDLLRGIEKLLPKTKPVTVVQERVIVQSSPLGGNSGPDISSLLKRAFLFLEDGDWKSANEYCEKVLDIDPENAQAYLGKLMAELHVECIESLKDCEKPFDNNTNYSKVLRFGDDSLKAELAEYLEAIRFQNENVLREELYCQAKSLMEGKNEPEKLHTAILHLRKIPGYRDADSLLTICQEALEKAEAKQREAEAKKAAFLEIVAQTRHTIAAGNNFTVAVKSDGTVLAVGNNRDGQCNVEKWNNIIAVTAGYGHTAGLCSDGTVVAVGYNQSGACDVSNWRDIVAISAGDFYTMGVRSDGTVVYTGNLPKCSVFFDWENITAVRGGTDHTVGLKSNGTVLAVGDIDWHQCKVSDWKKITDIGSGHRYTVGLQKNGTLIQTGFEKKNCHGSEWRDIVAISANADHFVALRSDGSVLAAGDNSNDQCEVKDWKNIVAVCAGRLHTIGLRSDGTVVAAGRSFEGQCNVSGWKLFENLENIEAERKEATEKRNAKIKQQAQWRASGKCQHCGGELKGFFGKKCVSCGKPKDY